MTQRQIEVMLDVMAARPQWFRARSSGERVTLASLYRYRMLERRTRRGSDGEANAAYEYRPTKEFLAFAREQGWK